MSRVLGTAEDDIAAWEKRAAQIEKELQEKIRRRERVSKNVHVVHQEQLTFGQRVSDKLADVAGSWAFIFGFGIILGMWILMNTVALIHHWDKYPYILLNLFLSMLAAIQAPVIMMSQNRQEDRDRIRAEHDYEVNLKAEIEIQHLDQKLDELRRSSGTTCWPSRSSRSTCWRRSSRCCRARRARNASLRLGVGKCDRGMAVKAIPLSCP